TYESLECLLLRSGFLRNHAVWFGAVLVLEPIFFIKIYLNTGLTIFAVAFGMGVVSGVVMSYQFGTKLE
ncbi:hypothetical protein, partial [Staphylococcus aureus]|uniref:hypothetical protein n=1 Tax=Staphylococcus aureus TaxID=1280 RepID=UPI003F753540